jgi:hypothetical protein
LRDCAGETCGSTGLTRPRRPRVPTDDLAQRSRQQRQSRLLRPSRLRQRTIRLVQRGRRERADRCLRRNFPRRPLPGDRVILWRSARVPSDPGCTAFAFWACCWRRSGFTERWRSRSAPGPANSASGSR